MSQIQIPNLPAVISLSGAELFEGVQAGTSVKISLSQVAALLKVNNGAVTFPLGVDVGGTGIVSYAIGDMIYASAATTLSKVAAGAAGNVLLSGATPSWGKVDLTSYVTNTLPNANGGTGLSSYNGGDLLCANSLGVLAVRAAVARGSALISNGTGIPPVYGSIDLTTTVTGILPISNGGTNASTASGARTSLGLGSIATQNANSVTISGGTVNGTTIGATARAIANVTDLDANNNVILGGSSANTVTVNAIMGVSAAPVAGKGSLQVGTIGYTDTGIVTSLASATAGFSQIILQNTSNATNASVNFNVSNNLATATTNYGELGMNSSTFTGTGSINAAGAVYLAAGSTDLVVATYGANAIHFVVNSGATDAMTISGTGVISGAGVTALMAAPGPIGSVTASTGAFTTLSASSTVSGAGFSTYLASPPAIGGTAAAAGAFTTLTSTGGGINGTVGAATPSTGAFTTVTASTSVLSSGAGGVGYSTGAGVAVTQLTSRTTATPTTGNKTTGAITLFTTTAVVGTYFSFTVPNTAIAITDTVVVTVRGATNTYVAFVSAIVAATSFTITMASVVGTASDTPIVNFTIIKGVSA